MDEKVIMGEVAKVANNLEGLINVVATLTKRVIEQTTRIEMLEAELQRQRIGLH